MILIIDDDTDTTQLVQKILLHNGFQVSVAKSAAEGVQKSVELKPKLILLDITLPDQTGFQVLQSLRDSKQATSTPIVLFSASHSYEKAIQEGADDFLNKPFTPDELLSIVAKYSR